MIGKSIFVGFIASSRNLDDFNIFSGYLCVENGVITKLGTKDELASLESDFLTEYNVKYLSEHQFMMPGFVDCHTHAPQFPNIGLGLDRPLLEWLDKYTFPLENKYHDIEFAKKIYDIVVKRLIANGTTTACYFGSIHLEGTLELVKATMHRHQRALIGKVSMNIQNNAGYFNPTEKELEDVEIFIKKVLAYENDLVLPVISPRFAVSCDETLMTGLATLSTKYNCRIQSHISENNKEIEHVLSINPGSKNYSEVYDKSNILNNKCIMAHAVYMSEEEMALFSRKGVSVAHCPASNTRLSSGLCPIRKFIDNRVTVGLGTDVSGGDSASILDAMRRAMDVSTHLHFQDANSRPINWKEAFYLATLGGAKALNLDNKIGSFEVGKEFDALLIDVYTTDGQMDLFDYSTDKTEEEHAESLIQKFIYVGDDRNITHVYVKGKNIKV